jgi:hypothetical protein
MPPERSKDCCHRTLSSPKDPFVLQYLPYDSEQRRCTVGDKGKKDKDKDQKQKTSKQKQEAKKKEGKQPKRTA